MQFTRLLLLVAAIATLAALGQADKIESGGPDEDTMDLEVQDDNIGGLGDGDTRDAVELGAEDDKAGGFTKAETPEQKPAVPYTPPSTEGLLFAELFDGDVFSRWIKSVVPKFSGEWTVTTRAKEAITGDKGLRVMEAAKHHGIAVALPKLESNKGKAVAVSYEVKFEDGLQCGGAYFKLFHRKDLKTPSSLETFDNETPYTIMFGPDTCGATDRVHFIIKHQNPISKEWVEHHLKDPPRIARGQVTHVYGFLISPDNTYKVLVDGVVKKEGSMMEDFEPPFTPSTEIDDPEDKKPEDWVDQAQIPDASAEKPADWDENAPPQIPDPTAEKPADWLEDEPKTIPDPAASQPEDWDEAEDGPWSAPLIPNPACADISGCGKWVAPSVPNPDFKGKWHPPMIPNPAYKGPWEPRKIPNPHYFENTDPHAIADIDALGFELWTMQSGILFDNVVVARSLDPIQNFVQQTWKVRYDIEDAKVMDEEKAAKENKPPMPVSGVWKRALAAASAYPVPAAMGIVTVLLTLMVSLMRTGGSRGQKAPSAATNASKSTPVGTTESKPTTAASSTADKLVPEATSAAMAEKSASLAEKSGSTAEDEDEAAAEGPMSGEEDVLKADSHHGRSGGARRRAAVKRD